MRRHEFRSVAGGPATHSAWHPRSLRTPLSGRRAEEGTDAGAKTQRAISCERAFCESAGAQGFHSEIVSEIASSPVQSLWTSWRRSDRSTRRWTFLCPLWAAQPLRVQVLSRRAQFVLLEGTMGKIPLRLSVQVSGTKGGGRLADGSPGYLLDQRLTVMFPTGALTLLSMAGPVLWNSTPAHVLGNKNSLWTLLCDRETQTVAELREQRIQANVEALNAIRRSIMGQGTPEIQQPQHILQGQQGVGVDRAAALFGLSLLLTAAPPARRSRGAFLSRLPAPTRLQKNQPARLLCGTALDRVEGVKCPTLVSSFSLSNAARLAHSGAAALVPEPGTWTPPTTNS